MIDLAHARYGYGLFLLPPQKKKFKWERFHSFFVFVLALHIMLFIYIGTHFNFNIKPRLDMYEVNLVRKKNKKVIQNKKKQKPRDMSDARRLKSPYSLKNRVPGLKKNTKIPSMASPPKRDNAAANLPVKIKLPKAKYKKFNPKSKHKVFKTPRISHERGVPSGREDGILDSKGTDGDKKGIGGGDGIEGGGEGGWGGGLEDMPWVFIDYQMHLSAGNPPEIKEKKKFYYRSLTANPLLVQAGGAENDWEVKIMGDAAIKFNLTIPKVDYIAELGISPSNVEFVKVNKIEKPENREKLIRIATSIVTSSGWFPAKERGEAVERTIPVVVVFYGRRKRQ